jgi:hypothetical protein
MRHRRPPNVGKSTLFNALTKAGIAAENYPFCTIEPNVGVVEVPDPRLAKLAAIDKPLKVIPAIVEFVDIAGLVAGRLQGGGPGQPVPRQHPRDECDRQRGALLRGRQRHPREQQGGSDFRHRGDPHGAGTRRHAVDREGQAPLRQDAARGRQGGDEDRAPARACREGARRIAPRCASWASAPTRWRCCSRCNCSPPSPRSTSPTWASTASRAIRSSSGSRSMRRRKARPWSPSAPSSRARSPASTRRRRRCSSKTWA